MRYRKASRFALMAKNNKKKKKKKKKKKAENSVYRRLCGIELGGGVESVKETGGVAVIGEELCLAI